MNMDERQRICWLQANRVTLILVGLVWIGMIGFELVAREVPYSLLIMVPIFAVIRFAAYKVYTRRL
jgi:uncharacterized membrane protein